MLETLQPVFSMWIFTLIWMVALAASFALLARVFPCNPGMSWWQDRKAVMTDAVYWLLLPLAFPIFRQLIVIVGAALLFVGTSDRDLVRFFMQGTGYGPVADWPLWVQAIVSLFLSDIYLYWVHRMLHTKAWWNFHAIHHSPKVLDWMSTRRFHFVNTIISFTVADVLMMLLGFSPLAMVLLAPFNIAFSALVHANLNWTFGPFRHVLASPVFHRWHHTSYKEGGMKNFAPTFPILDIIFGTYYMPKDRMPSGYGVSDPDFPEDFWGQFVYPFRKLKKNRAG